MAQLDQGHRNREPSSGHQCQKVRQLLAIPACPVQVWEQIAQQALAEWIRNLADKQNGVSSRPLVIAPWLEGGGGQAALLGILDTLEPGSCDLVILFAGSRNHGTVLERVSTVFDIGAQRSPLGMLVAAFKLARLLPRYRTYYSLMRASHVVLGMVPRVAAGHRLAATFHQLPSTDRGSAVYRMEEFLIRRALRHAELVTAPSTRAVAEIIQYRLAAPSQVRVEPNIIRYSTRPTVPPTECRPDVRLLVAGRLSAQKGIDELPRLLRNVSRPIQLRIAGEGECLSALRGQLWPTNVNVEFVGHVKDVSQHLDWSDAVIMPSRWELNPVIVWEAWSRGRPVIASDLDVFRDLAQMGPLWIFDSPTSLQELLAPEKLDAARRRAHETGQIRAEKGNAHGAITRFLTLEGADGTHSSRL